MVFSEIDIKYSVELLLLKGYAKHITLFYWSYKKFLYDKPLDKCKEIIYNCNSSLQIVT